MAKNLKQTFGDRASEFFLSLNPEFKLPKHFEFLMPYDSTRVQEITGNFFRKFYSDNDKRIFILGINPGRFGAGSTGIAFTDPVRLKTDCGIENSLEQRSELSSTFIYEMIKSWGGVKSFYDRFFLTAVCPVGFIAHGKNINYYDDSTLLRSSYGFIIETLKHQLSFGAHRKIAICLGEGKNYNFLSSLNEEFNLFDEIYPLAHPRFIMQYKRKKLQDYIGIYIETLEKAVQKTVS